MNELRLNVVLRNKQFVNLCISGIEIEESILYALDVTGKKIGFFDLGYVNAYWISDSKIGPGKELRNALN